MSFVAGRLALERTPEDAVEIEEHAHFLKFRRGHVLVRALPPSAVARPAAGVCNEFAAFVVYWDDDALPHHRLLAHAIAETESLNDMAWETPLGEIRGASGRS